MSKLNYYKDILLQTISCFTQTRLSNESVEPYCF